MSSTDRISLTVLGREIGTHTGWDQVSDSGLMFYDYVPGNGIDLPAGDLFFDYHAGTYALYDDEGKETVSGDIVKPLATLPRAA